MPLRLSALLAGGLLVASACASPNEQPAGSLAPRTLTPDAAEAILPDGATSAAEAPGRRIVPRDLLQVTVFEAPELSGEPRVSDTGEISLPLLGVVQAAGHTPRELEEALVVRLQSKYMRDPHVSVQVKEAAAQPIYVLGEVNQPGAFGTGDQDSVTLLRAVSLAGGLTSGAAPRRVMVIRTAPDGSRLQLPVDLAEVLTGQAADVILQVNDVVYVPKNTGRAFTLGAIDALVRLLTFRPAF